MGESKAKNKIIRLGLQDKVEQLIASGIVTGSGISDALKRDGYNVSQPTVSRYLKDELETRRNQTREIVEKHVRETVPADLTALETMEKKCLEWAGEENHAFSHRLAARHIEEAAPGWIKMILQLSSDEHKKKAMKGIISQCLLWIADEIKLQSARILAMRQASSIIEMKLRYALGESTDGKIIFMDSERGDKLSRDENTGRLLIIPGGNS